MSIGVITSGIAPSAMAASVLEPAGRAHSFKPVAPLAAWDFGKKPVLRFEEMNVPASQVFKQVMQEHRVSQYVSRLDDITQTEVVTEEAYWQAYLVQYPTYKELVADEQRSARLHWRLEHLNAVATNRSTDSAYLTPREVISRKIAVELLTSLRALDAESGFLICGNLSRQPVSARERAATNALQSIYQFIDSGHSMFSVTLLVWLKKHNGPVQLAPEFIAFLSLLVRERLGAFPHLAGIQNEASLLELGLSRAELAKLSIFAAGHSIYSMLESLPPCKRAD